MKLRKLLLPLLCLVIGAQSLLAQDIHYTLFDMAPLRTNPAYTGAFLGTVRIGGIYRGQWLSVGSQGDVSTPSIYGDAPIVKGLRPQDWVGVGFVLVSDNAGPFNLQTNFGGLSAAYHLAANKKATSVLTIAGQYNQVQRRADRADNILSEQNIGSPFGGLGQNQTEFDDFDRERTTTNYNTFGAGLLFRSQLDKTSKMELGLAAHHLNSPNAGLVTGSGGGSGGGGQGNLDSDRRLTFVTHGRYTTELNEKWIASPAFFMQTTAGGGNEISLQAWAGRKIKPDFTLNFGLGYRVSDAAKILLGADIKDLRVALAYDITVSSASPITNTVGGFEIAVYNIFKVYKKPSIPPAVLCPKF